MGHRSGQWNPEIQAGLHEGSSRTSGEVGRAGGEQRRVHAMRAPSTELVHRPTGGRLHDARSLARDRCLKVDECQRRRLDELRFADRCRHAEERLVGKHGSAFRNAPDVAGEPQTAQIVEKRRRHAVQRGLLAKAFDVGRLELESREKSRKGSRPAATRNARCGGSRRTNSSKVAVVDSWRPVAK